MISCIVHNVQAVKFFAKADYFQHSESDSVGSVVLFCGKVDSAINSKNPSSDNQQHSRPLVAQRPSLSRQPSQVPALSLPNQQPQTHPHRLTPHKLPPPTPTTNSPTQRGQHSSGSWVVLWQCATGGHSTDWQKVSPFLH